MSHPFIKSLLLLSLWTPLFVPLVCWAGNSEQPDAIGKISAQTILTHYSEFQQEYQRFEPSESEIRHMSRLTGKSLLVMFGSWCHDSEREVPRLIKLLDESKVQLTGLTFLAVDQKKQEPSGLAKQHNLKYTPTIVLLEGNKEVGRIVERPNSSLALDLSGLVAN